MGRDNNVREDRDLEWKSHTPAISSLNDRVDNIVDLFMVASGNLKGSQPVLLALEGLYQKYSKYFGEDKLKIKKALISTRKKLNSRNYKDSLKEYLNQPNIDLKEGILNYETKRLELLDKVFTRMNDHFVNSNLFPKPQITKHEQQSKRMKGSVL